MFCIQTCIALVNLYRVNHSISTSRNHSFTLFRVVWISWLSGMESGKWKRCRLVFHTQLYNKFCYKIKLTSYGWEEALKKFLFSIWRLCQPFHFAKMHKLKAVKNEKTSNIGREIEWDAVLGNVSSSRFSVGARFKFFRSSSNFRAVGLKLQSQNILLNYVCCPNFSDS